MKARQLQSQSQEVQSSDWHNTAPTINVVTPGPLALCKALGPLPGGRPVGADSPGKEILDTPSASIMGRRANP